MSTLALQRCATHLEREAAVRCPQCHRYFCRECATEHDGRMMCVQCIAAITRPKGARQTSTLRWSALCLTGVLFAWIVYYYLGMSLAHIPAAFHGGTP